MLPLGNVVPTAKESQFSISAPGNYASKLTRLVILISKAFAGVINMKKISIKINQDINLNHDIMKFFRFILLLIAV